MRLSSYTHSFAFLALSFIFCLLPAALSIDSKDAAAALKPLLDDSIGARASSRTTRRRRRCSPTGIYGTGLPSSPSATGTNYGYLGNNDTTLAKPLSYFRTSTAQSSTLETGFVLSELFSFASPGHGLLTKALTTSGLPSVASSGSDPLPNGGSDASSAGSSDTGSALSPTICGRKATITVSTQYTFTVTVTEAAMTTGSNNASPFASILSSSTGHKHTKCSKTKASGTAAASASSGLGALNGNDTLGIPHIYKL